MSYSKLSVDRNKRLARYGVSTLREGLVSLLRVQAMVGGTILVCCCAAIILSVSGCACQPRPAAGLSSVFQVMARRMNNLDVDYTHGYSGLDATWTHASAGMLETMFATCDVLNGVSSGDGWRDPSVTSTMHLKTGLATGWEELLDACNDPDRFAAAHSVLVRVASYCHWEAYDKLGLIGRFDASGGELYNWFGLNLSFDCPSRVDSSQRAGIRAMWKEFYETSVKPVLKARGEFKRSVLVGDDIPIDASGMYPPDPD